MALRAVGPTQKGQRGPSGQRIATRQAMHFSSESKKRLNSLRDLKIRSIS